MSQDAEYKPLSLAQHFEPPEHFSGYFAWMLFRRQQLFE